VNEFKDKTELAPPEVFTDKEALRKWLESYMGFKFHDQAVDFWWDICQARARNEYMIVHTARQYGFNTIRRALFGEPR
jgi:hypothetical protein